MIIWCEERLWYRKDYGILSCTVHGSRRFPGSDGKSIDYRTKLILYLTLILTLNSLSTSVSQRRGQREAQSNAHQCFFSKTKKITSSSSSLYFPIVVWAVSIVARLTIQSCSSVAILCEIGRRRSPSPFMYQ